MNGRKLSIVSMVWIVALMVCATFPVDVQARSSQEEEPSLFRTADNCMACHNLLADPSGDDASIGLHWRPSMMANAARDPYWHAGVQREVTNHPEAREAIEGECSICHMPMTRYETRIHGKKGDVFAHLPVGDKDAPANLLAADGVSCSVCHQISDEHLGDEESFVGHFVVNSTRPWESGKSSDPTRWTRENHHHAFGLSIRASRRDPHSKLGICATCHTLMTSALGPGGEVIGELPEQVPYQEWLHSDYRTERSCQSCHMPEVEGEMLISSVWGEPRTESPSTCFGAVTSSCRESQSVSRGPRVEAYPQELRVPLGAPHGGASSVPGGSLIRRIESMSRTDVSTRRSPSSISPGTNCPAPILPVAFGFTSV